MDRQIGIVGAGVIGAGVGRFFSNAGWRDLRVVRL
jgi:3-hydroxyacyl-CoA dehydrogenase